MPIYSGVVRLTRGFGIDAWSKAEMANTFNDITAAFTGCGMVMAPIEDYPERAGIFYYDTWEGDTEITQSSEEVGTRVNKLWGKNAFIHPQAGFVVEVEYRLANTYKDIASPYYYSFLYATYNVAHSLEAGALVRSSRNALNYALGMPSDAKQTSIYSFSRHDRDIALIGTTTPTTFTLCSGEDIGDDTPNTGYTPLGIHVEALGDALIVVTPYEIDKDSNSGGKATAGYNYRGFTSDMAGWRMSRDLIFGTLTCPPVASSSIGTRVARARAFIDGEEMLLSFGFISNGVAADGALMTIDLDGAGPKKYMHLPKMGHAGPSGLVTPLFAWDDS